MQSLRVRCGEVVIVQVSRVLSCRWYYSDRYLLYRLAQSLKMSAWIALAFIKASAVPDRSVRSGGLISRVGKSPAVRPIVP